MTNFCESVSEVAIKPISEYCRNRHYKCKGCRYSIKFIIPDYEGYTECVFADCPCDWETCDLDVVHNLNDARDCENCKNHTDGGCTVWDCNFEPKEA